MPITKPDNPWQYARPASWPESFELRRRPIVMAAVGRPTRRNGPGCSKKANRYGGVMAYLDCGCMILEDGMRWSWCLSCLNSPRRPTPTPVITCLNPFRSPTPTPYDIARLGPRSELRPEVLRFAEAMELKLRANDWKGGWKHEMPQSLLKRARDKVQELDDVVDEICGMGLSPERIAAVWSEAGDAANFLMMVALVSTAEGWNIPSVVAGRSMAGGKANHHYLCPCGWGQWRRVPPWAVRLFGARCDGCGRRRRLLHRCVYCRPTGSDRC